MKAIIRREDEEGLQIDNIRDVGIIKYYKEYGRQGKKEKLELWTHSMCPIRTIEFDGHTQVILKGDL